MQRFLGLYMPDSHTVKDDHRHGDRHHNSKHCNNSNNYYDCNCDADNPCSYSPIPSAQIDLGSWQEKELSERRMRYLGFSFHDEFEVLKEIVDGYGGWTFCPIQYNCLDTESSSRAPGMRGLEYASSKGFAVVVMEPIQGGNLAVKPPTEIQTIWNEEGKRSPAEWALQLVWNQPEVSVVLSGMSTMSHVIENIASANRSGPGTLIEELNLTSRVCESYLSHGFIGCTGCGYCTPCPSGVAIPEILALYNEFFKARQGSAAGDRSQV